jgi:hypothetical protein
MLQFPKLGRTFVFSVMRMLRCVQILQRAPLVSRLVAAKLVAAPWSSFSAAGRGGEDERTQHLKITHAAAQRPQRSSRGRGGGGHINYQAGRGGGGRGRNSSNDSLKFRQIRLMRCMQELGNSKMWGEAVATLRKAQRQPFPVNTIIDSAAITACAKSGEWEPAVKLLKELNHTVGIRLM